MKFLGQIFFRRPRVLNQLHRFGLTAATSQTNEEELAALSRYASGAHQAIEIGTHQGVSAARIAGAMAKDATLFCVDPWPKVNGRENPCWQICERHLRRTGTERRIKIVRGFSGDVQHLLPASVDFAFIDGDHSWSGIETDWKIVWQRIRPGGFVCLHDTVVPGPEPWRVFDSVRFLNEVISSDACFQRVEVVYSMTVLQRIHQ